MSSQNYSATIHVRDPQNPQGPLLTVYYDTVGKPGQSADAIRRAAHRYAAAEIPGGQVVGSAVSTDGIRH